MDKKQTFYQKYGKRILDIILSLVFITFFFWLYFIISILVRFKMGSPVIYRQARPGKDEDIFEMYKFRTMTDEKDHNGNLLPDIMRLTKFGKFLRTSSLDELPELINILKGDMSIVGPRPLLVKYLPLYNERQKRRHEVKPGLTGYAQIHGRNNTSWEERFELDVYYVDNVTFFGDFKILIGTIFTVFRREGIDSSGTSNVTMEEFTGNGNKWNKNTLFFDLSR